MKFRPTPEIVEACYAWLRITPPFRAWKLPHPDDVEFFITAHRDRAAHYRGLDEAGKGRHTHPEIAVSINGVKHYWHMVEALAHELVHFHLDRIGKCDDHGPNFKRCARKVCRYFGFAERDFVDDN